MSITYTPAQAAHECLNSSIVRMLFTRPRKAVPEKRVRLRKINVKGKDCYQVETVKNNQAFQKNIEFDLLSDIITGYFTLFRSVECCGEEEQLFFLQNNKGSIALTKRTPRSASVTGMQEHNKIKNYLIPEGNPLAFLIEQGVMNADGIVLKKKYHKFRQMNKFLEFIADIEPFIRDTVAHSGKPFLITDFGCGKAYLSFALYYYLHERQKLPVCIHGLDLKAEIIARCATLAETCGYTGLSFAEGNIADYVFPDDTGMIVCLHACDTATDLALAQAIRQNVPVIFAVPCCQHELYAQLKAQKNTFHTEKRLFSPFMEHGIITERFASILTDTIRALILQSFGYTVRIVEFIETEHTPKNLLIHAVKKVQPPEQEKRLREEALRKYRDIKENLSVKPILEKLLEMPLTRL